MSNDDKSVSMRSAAATADHTLKVQQQQPEVTTLTQAIRRDELASTAHFARQSAASFKLDDPHTTTASESSKSDSDAMDIERVTQQSDSDSNDDVDEDLSVDEGESENDDEDELKQAARAGIQLLEENAQLAEEVRHLQLQLSHTAELQRVLADKDARIEQLTQHLRESIRENHSLLSELTQLREQVATHKTLLAQHQRSPWKRSARGGSPTRLVFQQHLALELNDPSLRSASDATSDADATAALDAHSASHSAVTRTSSLPNATTGAAASSPVGPISPKRRHSARLEEVERKFEDAHRRNSLLKLELSSVQKTVSALKPLSAQLHEAREETQMLQARANTLTNQLQLLMDERTEERALLQSLRATVEIYQSLDDPTRSVRLHGDSRRCIDDNGDAEQTRRLARMRRRKSDGCVLPLPTGSGALKPPTCWTNSATSCFHSTQDDNDAILESLDALSDQVLGLQQLEARLVPSAPTAGLQSQQQVRASPSTRDDSTLALGGADHWPRSAFLVQQVSVLQDLLKRYRAQWQRASEYRHALESERAQLLSRVAALSLLAQRQCALCARANKELAHESEAWQAAANAYETLLQRATEAVGHEDEAEAEHVCFAILRRLVSSWTADKSKRMRLHDWLTNAIRSTGTRKALYLPDLTHEIASGFQMLLVPILREKFGVAVHVETRQRTVVVTDLKLRVIETDAAKATACLQRIRRSLLWLLDAEEAVQFEESEWVGEFARKKAARVCLSK